MTLTSVSDVDGDGVTESDGVQVASAVSLAESVDDEDGVRVSVSLGREV